MSDPGENFPSDGGLLYFLREKAETEQRKNSTQLRLTWKNLLYLNQVFALSFLWHRHNLSMLRTLWYIRTINSSRRIFSGSLNMWREIKTKHRKKILYTAIHQSPFPQSLYICIWYTMVTAHCHYLVAKCCAHNRVYSANMQKKHQQQQQRKLKGIRYWSNG